MDTKKTRKSASKWEQISERTLLEIWGGKMSDLRGCRKNTHILLEMAAELEVLGYKYSVLELKTKMHNMTARYRKEKQKVGTTGGSPSEWDLYQEMDVLLAPYKSYNCEDLLVDSINVYRDIPVNCRADELARLETLHVSQELESVEVPLTTWTCKPVAVVLAHPEPPLTYLGPQIAIPLNNHNYQQLPKEQSVAEFDIPDAMYIAPSNNALQEDSYNAAYRHSSTQHQSGYGNAPTETQIHKHIYVHVPPPDFEDDEMTPRVVHQVAPKQMHYKIVFIKAPSIPGVRPPVVPPTPQNEEKTLIYVLHKKPETQPEIVIPTPAPTKPSKPEVYFIKYKTKKDEAPVYGPPPATYEIQARSAVEPAALPENGNDFGAMDLSQYEPQLTTAQPGNVEETQPPQFIGEERAAEFYSAPTMSAYMGDEVQTTAANPSLQYLAPETTSAPIVVAEMEDQPHVPAASYGTPNRYFIKRRK